MPRAASVERHIVFMDELRRHSDREVCLGAAEYAAEHQAWVFDPWPIGCSPATAPAWVDFKIVDGILTTESAMRQVQGFRGGPRIPIVYCLADNPHADADSVCLDERAVGEMAAEHLWARGYRQFAFVGSAATGWSRQRCCGFSEWLATVGKEPSIHLFSLANLPVFWSWNLARRNRHLQELLIGLPRPCGIFAANDVIACFVLQAAHHNGCRVPEDFSVVGVDNDPFPNSAAGLAISSIELPFREVGRQAARLLEERWAGARLGRVVRLRPIRVVVRASTDAFMTQDPLVRRAQAYVEARRHKRVAIAEITQALGTNRVTLGKHFQRELDVSLLEYVRGRRLAFAMELLRQGDATVDEVAWECGFSSTSNFSHVLKTVTGYRPGALRRLYSEDRSGSQKDKQQDSGP